MPLARLQIRLPRSIELVVSLLAVLKSGAAYAPLDLDHPAGRLSSILADTDPVVVLTTGSVAASLPGEAATLLLDDPCTTAQLAALPDGDLRTARAAGPAPQDTAYVIHTSGSTGRPKGAAVSHRAICNRLRWMQDAYGLTEDDRVLHKTSSGFDVSVREFFWPLITGATLVVARPGGHRDPAYLAELMISQEGIATVHFVPAMLSAYLAEPGSALPTRLRRIICSGEALPADLATRAAQAMGAPVHNLYGPTEAAVDVTACAHDPGRPGASVPIGRPVWNTRTHVLDAFLQPVAPGSAGELYLADVQLASGYLGRPALTAQRFVADPFGPPGSRMYRTGDLVRQSPQSELEYLGRTDHQVKLRGLRIELGEIEAALTADDSTSTRAQVPLPPPRDHAPHRPTATDQEVHHVRRLRAAHPGDDEGHRPAG